MSRSTTTDGASWLLQTRVVLAAYRREHQLAARLIGKLLGWPLDPTDPAYEQFVKTLCAVAFCPDEKGD
jgi:hypothetical protein